MQSMESGESALSPDLPAGEELIFEFMLNALRLVEGFQESWFEERTGLAAVTLRESAADALE